MSNIYALEALLLAHLRANCPSVHFIAGVPDAAAIAKNSQFVNERPNPVLDSTGAGSTRYGGVFVCPASDFNGIEQVSSTSEGGCTLTTQKWLLCVAAKNQLKLDVAINDQVCPSREDSGTLTAEVITAMHSFSWLPAGWVAARARLTANRAATGLPANVFPDVNGLYVTALAYETQALP